MGQAQKASLRRRSLHEIELLRRMAAPDAGESPRDDGVREDATGGWWGAPPDEHGSDNELYLMD